MTVAAQATTVIPPTFDSLVSKSQTIFVGEVIATRSEWIATPHGRAITTRVTFKVEDVWKGAVGAVTQLEFMGGTVGGITMDVVGMPQFRDGERALLFVSGQAKPVSPLVGFFHGRMPVDRDRFGVDRVRTYDGLPLTSPDAIGVSGAARITLAPAMPLTDLGAAVRARITAQRGR